jgi:Transposase zinc-binding domain/AI2M/AI1M-like, HNH endonuclease
METSLLKTLAGKGRTTVARTLKRLKSTTQTPNGPRKCLKLTIARPGKKPLIAIFGGLSLQRKHTAIKDQVVRPYLRRRSELVARLLNDTCDVCGSKEHVEMHHIRHLADRNKRGRREKPLWMPIMSARKRKSIPLGRRCHLDGHSNRPKARRQGNERAVCHERGQHGLEGDRGKRQSTLTSPAVYPTLSNIVACTVDRGQHLVAMSCKSSLCLRCAKVTVDNWVSQVSQMLHEGVIYRHILLTVPACSARRFITTRRSC